MKAARGLYVESKRAHMRRFSAELTACRSSFCVKRGIKARGACRKLLHRLHVTSLLMAFLLSCFVLVLQWDADLPSTLNSPFTIMDALHDAIHDLRTAGFYSRNTVPLNPKIVNDIHKRGGTILGTSRGGHDTTKIVNSIEDRGINQVYIIGGDGTQKGAACIYEEVRKRGLKISVIGVPKTIDNDIAVIDRSFGFDTAVEEAQRAINAAHTEAESVHNGIGLVKLMGRYSGYIAMYATLASRDVDLCLIPEVPFYLEGEGGLYEFVEKRVRENGHMVIVVAEGAGQELMEQTEGVQDASGNKLLLDIGLWISKKLKEYYSSNKGESLNLKYIDPTYMIRAIPSNAADNVYCTLLAQSGIHGAMAGYTGFTVGPVNGRHAYIPISRVTERQNRVNIADRMWARLLSSTNQPAFIDAEKINKKEPKEAPKADEHLKGLSKQISDIFASSNSHGTNGSLVTDAPAEKAVSEAKEDGSVH